MNKDKQQKEVSLRNINVQISLSVFLCILSLSSYFVFSSYDNSIDSEERNVLKTLKAITSTIALQINGDEHELMFNHYKTKDAIPSVDFDSTYFQIHNMLKAVSEVNNLTSPIYTAVYSFEKKEFLMGVTSSPNPSFKHSYTSYPKQVVENYKLGGTILTYEDDFDSWLSAFSPIKNSKGEVIAIIQTDVTFTGFINEARSQLKTNALLAFFALITVGIVLFFSLKSILSNDTLAKEQLITSKQIIQTKQTELLDSMKYAKRIQSAILPSAKLVKEYLKESFILYKPKDIVAGDFYWMEHKDSKVLFAAADCTGHGVPGAMVSVVCNNALNRSVREHGLTDPGQILDKTREIVVAEFEKSEEEVKDGMDIAICSLEGNKLKYAGAHNPLWIIRNGEILETKANKQPIGQFDHTEPYTTHSFDLEQGDAIYIFSDGYVDQFGGKKGKKFKAAAFRELLLSIQDKPMETQKTIIDESFNSWKGDLEQIDDVCVIGVKI
jgi:serine phosphatase RsbU (regulator of sigma subunit)